MDHSLRILVVDDNRDAADSLGVLLKICGHEVSVEYDARSGLLKAVEMHPHVILHDIGMPGMNGYDAARSIRKDLGLMDSVLIAATGYTTKEDKQRAREAGFDHHLGKPIDLDALEAILEQRSAARKD